MNPIQHIIDYREHMGVASWERNPTRITSWYAYSSCGYVGPERMFRSDASEDLRKHRHECAGSQQPKQPKPKQYERQAAS